MLDPSTLDPTTPLLMLVLGKIAEDTIKAACNDYLKNKLVTVFTGMEKLGQKAKLEAIYIDALEKAYAACIELLLANLRAWGCSDEELKAYGGSLQSFVKDKAVAEELLKAIHDPLNTELPSPEVLAARWYALGCRELPEEGIWKSVASAFRRKAKQQAFLNPELRENVTARNVDRLCELLERRAGVPHEAQPEQYVERMRKRYAFVDLANLMPSYANDPGQLVIHDVFVAQTVRADPPLVEIPKDILERLRREGVAYVDDLDLEERDRERLRADLNRMRERDVSQSPRGVLDVIADPANRLVVLTGEPGAGKSTLLRYLLLGVLEPPCDKSGKPLPWTQGFTGAFPLLIELRDFHALQEKGECDTFLDYADYLGRTQQWGLEARWLHKHLDNKSSLIMFDGLDEIFDRGERERVMQEIVGFAQRYKKARILVTSRPVGYRDSILRNAEFRHFGIQDLDGPRIEQFIRGWFTLTFPQDPETAGQRIQRVLGSVKDSKAIRLLAGNPMLLTMMALLAREQELPRERVAFYEKSVELLCHKWDANRNLPLLGGEPLTVEDKKDLLQNVAMQMQTGPGGLAGNFIHEGDLEETLKAWFMEQFRQPAYEAIHAARTMIMTLRERNHILCLRGPHLYGFVHRTFLEYLTAVEYIRRFHRERSLNEDDLVALFEMHCRDDSWREVLRLICGQIDEKFTGSIIEALITHADLDHWDAKTPLPELPLAILCLGECRNPCRIKAVGVQLFKAVVTCLLNVKDWLLIDEFLETDLLEAVREIGPRWPDTRELREYVLSRQIPSSLDIGLLWSQFIAAVVRERDIIRRLAGDSNASIRSGAFRALAEYWPDEETRRFLLDRAVKDESAHSRRMALGDLAAHWPDEETRRFLLDRAVKDESEWARCSALEALAGKWTDEATRRFLRERAIKDEGWIPRGSALGALAEKWPDEETRRFMQERAEKDEGEWVRGNALRDLAGKWPDEETRLFLQERAKRDEGEGIRSSALIVLVWRWPDAETRLFLQERAVKDEGEDPRSSALEALAETWPDEETRRFLRERAVKDEGVEPRRRALRALAEKWPDQPEQMAADAAD